MGGSDLYTGTLDVLILKALSGGPLHGYAIGLWLRRTSRDVFQVNEGVLYPALHRLQRNGWLAAKWGKTETKRRAKFYRIPAAGKANLDEYLERLAEHSHAVLKVLKTSTS
jgi:PadR family transcriptional regulator PadR